MDIFLTLFLKILPLYTLILLGFIAGKFLHVKKESVATLVIYLVTPVIFFNGIYTTHISLSTLSTPIVVFAISCVACLLMYAIASLFWKDSTRNMLSFMAGEGNTGYFGLPLALILFPNNYIGLYIFASVGILVYESTLGFFVAARGQHTIQESLLKLIKLPILYAIGLGLIINLFGIHFGPWYTDIVTNFKGAYTVLGMMIIGLGIAGISNYQFDFLFTLHAFFAKFILWPVLVFAIIFLDSHMFHFYSLEIYKILTLIAIVPIAANTVAYATFLRSHPEKVAVTVLLNTLFALVYIPIMVVYFLK